MDIPLDEMERWLILPALEFIRSFDIPIPPLSDHWQSVFVLLFLVTQRSAFHRNVWEPSSIIIWITGALLALLYAMFSGFTPINNIAIAWYGAAGLIVFIGTINVLGGRRWLFGILVVLVGLFLQGIARALRDAAPHSTNTEPLLVLVLTVLGVAIGSFVAGFIERRGPILSDPSMNLGLDITAAMGLAFGIAVLAADPPILALF